MCSALCFGTPSNLRALLGKSASIAENAREIWSCGEYLQSGGSV
jgi:hypothetical protein